MTEKTENQKCVCEEIPGYKFNEFDRRESWTVEEGTGGVEFYPNTDFISGVTLEALMEIGYGYLTVWSNGRICYRIPGYFKEYETYE